MQTNKASPAKSYRRSSMPATSTTTHRTSADIIAATKTPAAKSSGTSTTATAETGTPSQGSSGGEAYKSPITLTPVSQLPRGPRRLSRQEPPVTEPPAILDGDSFNPDGSLRTMHRMPGFDQSYAQAMKARYVRHREPVEREKELSVNEIFGKKETQST